MRGDSLEGGSREVPPVRLSLDDFLITKQAVVKPPRFGEGARTVLKYRTMKIAGHNPIPVLFTMDEMPTEKNAQVMESIGLYECRSAFEKRKRKPWRHGSTMTFAGGSSVNFENRVWTRLRKRLVEFLMRRPGGEVRNVQVRFMFGSGQFMF